MQETEWGKVRALILEQITLRIERREKKKSLIFEGKELSFYFFKMIKKIYLFVIGAFWVLGLCEFKKKLLVVMLLHVLKTRVLSSNEKIEGAFALTRVLSSFGFFLFPLQNLFHHQLLLSHTLFVFKLFSSYLILYLFSFSHQLL